MGLNFPDFFKRSSAGLLGIDISASSVKVVELLPGQKTAIRLERYAIEPIERGAINDGNVENPDLVAAALGRAMRRLGTRTREVALAMPASAVITKRIMLPAGLPEEDYELQVETEASQYIPFAIEEVNLDFQILGPSAIDADEIDVLLAASRKEKVEDRVAVAEMCGLRPVVVDIDSYAARIALEHVASFLPNGGQGQIIAVFDIGQSVTTVSIILNGATIFEREQIFGGQDLTQDLMRLYGLSLEEAELKKRTGELPENYRVDVLEPYIERGVTDITRALQFFFTSTPYSRVDRIYLAGGACVVPGLCEGVSDRTQVPAEILSPFQGMEIADTVRERQLRLDAPALVTACGLALRRFDA